MHEASDDHGTPVPGKPKVARFSFFPQSGAKAGHLAKNIQAWCSRNNIEPEKFDGLIQIMHCHNEHDESIPWQETVGAQGVDELRDTMRRFPLGTIQYVGPGTEKCWHREQWGGEWDAKAKRIVETIKESGHPVVDLVPIYPKGDFDGHFKTDDGTCTALAQGICLLARRGQFSSCSLRVTRHPERCC